MWNHIRIIKTIKALLPMWLKLIIIRLLVFTQHLYYYHFFPQKISEVNDKGKRKIFILFSTDYSNLGDHALTYAHKKLLENNFPESEIIEVLVSDTLKYLKYISDTIEQDDVITLKGGGNIGLEYFREELFRRVIISKFKKNRIILFPQTVFFPDTKKGEREFAKTISVFKSHPDFHPFLRDQESFDLVKDKLETARLIPDIVLSLSNPSIEKNRSGVTICLRSDKEGIYTKNEKEDIINIANMHFEKVRITDTVTEYVIKKELRESELNKIWSLFSSSELIITDRLHGMIFAAITSTPCIVFGTYNHKLLGQYKWLEELNFIKFAKYKEDDIGSAIEKLKNINVTPYNAQIYSEYYNEIVKLLKVNGERENER